MKVSAEAENLLDACEFAAWMGPEGMLRFLRELEDGGWHLLMEQSGPCAVAIAAERLGYIEVADDKCRITQDGQVMREQLWLIGHTVRVCSGEAK